MAAAAAGVEPEAGCDHFFLFFAFTFFFFFFLFTFFAFFFFFFSFFFFSCVFFLSRTAGSAAVQQQSTAADCGLHRSSHWLTASH